MVTTFCPGTLDSEQDSQYVQNTHLPSTYLSCRKSQICQLLRKFFSCFRTIVCYIEKSFPLRHRQYECLFCLTVIILTHFSYVATVVVHLHILTTACSSKCQYVIYPQVEGFFYVFHPLWAIRYTDEGEIWQKSPRCYAIYSFIPYFIFTDTDTGPQKL